MNEHRTDLELLRQFARQGRAGGIRGSGPAALEPGLCHRVAQGAVGQAVGVGEDAAQKRVAGAVERLAQFFQKRGFRTASVAAVAAALEGTAGSAPVGVAEAVISAASQLAAPAALGLAGPLARVIRIADPPLPSEGTEWFRLLR